MAREVQLAFLPEGSILGHLEAIRRVLDPASRSLPHLTIRHQKRPNPELWSAHEINWANVDLSLDAVQTLDASVDLSAVKTVVLSCSSVELDEDSYKPDYPDSVLHFSLYAGAASSFAATALRALSQLAWGVTYRGPLLPFRSSRDARAAYRFNVVSGAEMTIFGAAALNEAFEANEIEPGTAVGDLSDAQRLQVSLQLAARLALEPTLLPASSRVSEDVRRLSPLRPSQLAFWTDDEVRAFSPSEEPRSRSQLRVSSSFATPPELARDIMAALRPTLGSVPVEFGEPAVGNGVLYAAARRELGEDKIRSATGIEIDPETAVRTRRRWGRRGLDVIQADFLGVPPQEGKWTFLFGNPPYRRSQALGEKYSQVRSELEDNLGLQISGRSDLYVYFVLRAHKWLRHGAFAVWILPAEFLVTRYGDVLRAYLSTRVDLLRIHTYDSSDALFDNALTTTAVIVYRKKEPQYSSRVTVTRGGTMFSSREVLAIDKRSLIREKRWSFSSLSEDGTALGGVALGELFRVQRGIATGANRWFVISDDQATHLGVKPEWLRPLLPPPPQIQDGLVSAERGLLPRESAGWLIDTNESLDVIGREAPAFQSYLLELQAQVGDRPLVRRRQIPWLQEVRATPPFLFVYMSKKASERTRFVRNDSDAVGLNNFLYLYPTERLQTWLNDRPARYEELHKALRAVPVGELARWGREYGNGLLKLEPSDLRHVRISRFSW